MAKKAPKYQLGSYNHYLIPSAVGGAAAWMLSGELSLGLTVFVAVWMGSWIGNSVRRK